MSDLYKSITLPSDPRNVEQVEPFVDGLASRYNLSPDRKGDIMVSLMEAVTNAILHGNQSDRKKCVSISFLRKRDSLSLRLSDEGPGFDPAVVPDPTCPERVECCGGRGLLLMRHLSDECSFLKGGSTVEMRFKIK